MVNPLLDRTGEGPPGEITGISRERDVQPARECENNPERCHRTSAWPIRRTSSVPAGGQAQHSARPAFLSRMPGATWRSWAAFPRSGQRLLVR